jgi:hypothetical protein
MKYSMAENTKKSGRADGNVYMRNNVIRGMRMPANPQTPAQSVQRGNFSTLSGNWNGLTEAQRAAWNAFQINTFDNLGHPVQITGKTAYVLLNRNLFNAGQPFIDTPPVGARGPIAPSSVTLTADESSPTFSVAFTDTPIPGTATWLVFATASQTPGTYKPGRSKFKLITALAAGAASPQDVTAEYTAVFGAPVANASAFIRLVAIDNLSGYAAPGVTDRAIVTP